MTYFARRKKIWFGIFAGLGAAFVGFVGLMAGYAAIFSASSEAESGVLSPGTTALIADTGASGGSAVRFGATSGGAVNCPTEGRVRNVTTSIQLTSVLLSAQPGDIITLADGTYSGKYVASAAGTVDQPITIRGSDKAILDAGDTTGYPLKIAGSTTAYADYWCVQGITLARGATGFYVDLARHVTLAGTTIRDTGQEGVHYKSCSSNGVIADNHIFNTGLAKHDYGEGIYIGTAESNWASLNNCNTGSPDATNDVQILRNTIDHTTSESIDIKEGTIGGLIDGNSFDLVGMTGDNFSDSAIDLKGTGWTVSNNTVTRSGTSAAVDDFQIHIVDAQAAVTKSGTGNTLTGNKLNGQAPGYGVLVPSDGVNTIACSNTTNAVKGLLSVGACTP